MITLLAISDFRILVIDAQLLYFYKNFSDAKT